MSIFKKEMSAREKFVNGVKDVASTAGAIGLATVYLPALQLLRLQKSTLRLRHITTATTATIITRATTAVTTIAAFLTTRRISLATS